MKKKTILALGMAAVAAISINTTIAYFTSQTEKLSSTATIGNVKIEQFEYERKVDSNGKFVSTGEKDQYGWIPDVLQEVRQARTILPAVFTNGVTEWDNREVPEGALKTEHYQSWEEIGAPGANQLFDDSMKNVIDKFVFVENTGKNNAYVRTWFAFEQGDLLDEKMDELIGVNINTGSWSWKDVAKNVEIVDENGVVSKYNIMVATYTAMDGSGILTPDEIARPSLLQLYLNPTATSEDAEAIDGNNNGIYDVLVMSQAVQADGFADAETAFNATFGEATAKNHPFK